MDRLENLVKSAAAMGAARAEGFPAFIELFVQARQSSNLQTCKPSNLQTC
jgi:hypothetical protein